MIPWVNDIFFPIRYANMKILSKALAYLDKADNSVEVFMNDNGEYILGCCGELHLERCTSLLREKYCYGVEFQVSKPIVCYRETIVNILI